MEHRFLDRRTRFLVRALECEQMALDSHVPAAQQMWKAAAVTWREMAHSCDLMDALDRQHVAPWIVDLSARGENSAG